MTTFNERGVREQRDAVPDAGAPASAIGLIFGSGFLFSCLDTSGKFLVTAGFEAPFVAWVRFAVHLVLVLLLFRAWKNPALFRVSSLPWQIVRGGLLFGSTLCNFLALRTLQLAETVSIFFFAPMVITALAGPLLGEWAGWRRWMAILAGFAGVLVITRPGFGTFSIGHVFALGAMTCYSLYVILTRRMGARETAESLIFYSALTPVVLIFPAVPLYGTLPTDPLHWVVLVALGFFGGFGHWLLILAYRQATTYALAPYPYLQMVWMVAFGYVVFGDLPDAWTILGAAIIVTSGLYIVRREHKLRLAARKAARAQDGPQAKRL
ncbi:DMT family transporter [Nitratireductor sp. GCM10026969]|uniref:DMT family transporter n=1 Tax=Nitratireductor sp. GCM10026969 TaxID=3252645 RepID=UPI00362253CB